MHRAAREVLSVGVIDEDCHPLGNNERRATGHNADKELRTIAAQVCHTITEIEEFTNIA